MRRRTAPVLLFAAVSLALHICWVLWLPRDHARVRENPQWIEVAFEQHAPDRQASHSAAARAAVMPAPANRADETPVAPVVVAAKAATVRPRTMRTPAKTSRSAAPSAAPVTAPAKPAAGPTQPQATSAAPQLQAQSPPVTTRTPTPQRRPQLSARAAALGFETSTPALRCGAERNVIDRPDCASTDDGSAAEAALTDDLRAVAKFVPHLRPREQPQLHARSDGSYMYEGHVFKARVRPDGQVEFSDKISQTQLRVSLTPLKVIADVNDLVEKHVLGRELYSAEKHWFLDQTRELRAKLSDEYRRRELLSARRALERTLQSILADNTLSVRQKHDALFLIWQDCGEDAQAQAHRRAVEAFVRRNLPKGSRLGFRAEELERMNATRAGLRAFQPYSKG